MSSIKPSIAHGVQAIALFEALKGLLVILVSFGLFRAPEIIEHLHLKLNPADIRWLLLGAAAYSSLRFTEAYGLWHQRRWATWIAVISTAIYLPAEFYHLAREFSWVKIAITVFNLALVFYLWVNRSRHSS